jgi:hypothetical protein
MQHLAVLIVVAALTFAISRVKLYRLASTAHITEEIGLELDVTESDALAEWTSTIAGYTLLIALTLLGAVSVMKDDPMPLPLPVVDRPAALLHSRALVDCNGGRPVERGSAQPRVSGPTDTFERRIAAPPQRVAFRLGGDTCSGQSGRDGDENQAVSERAIMAAQRFLAQLCHDVASAIDVADSAMRSLSPSEGHHFTCDNVLKEIFPIPGVQLQLEKAACLLNERAKLVARMQQGRDLQGIYAQRRECEKHIAGIDGRLSVEEFLDVTTSFDCSGDRLLRAYVCERIRHFSSPQKFRSFDNLRGDRESWRPGFPSDSQLLSHLLVKKELAVHSNKRIPVGKTAVLAIGSTGDPYFFVKYRRGAHEVILRPPPGEKSLFEALVRQAEIERKSGLRPIFRVE